MPTASMITTSTAWEQIMKCYKQTLCSQYGITNSLLWGWQWPFKSSGGWGMCSKGVRYKYIPAQRGDSIIFITTSITIVTTNNHFVPKLIIFSIYYEHFSTEKLSNKIYNLCENNNIHHHITGPWQPKKKTNMAFTHSMYDIKRFSYNLL